MTDISPVKEEREDAASPRLDRTISTTLRNIGIPAHLKGFRYMSDAVKLLMDSPLLTVTKSVYPSVAETRGTTPHCVERAIRHAIDTSVKRNGLAPPFRKKPTNSEFLCTLSELVRDKL